MKRFTLVSIFVSYLVAFPIMAQTEDFAAMGEEGIKAFSEGDLITAMNLLSKSAEQGYAPAQATLGYLFDKSDDDQVAFEWFEKSARQNHAPGQFGLANMYKKGEGVEADPIQAGRWMFKAAMQDYVPAVRAYAYALEQGGLGLKKNPRLAARWFNRCHQEGDVVCTRRLAMAYERGQLGFRANPDRAKELYDQLNVGQKSKK